MMIDNCSHKTQQTEAVSLLNQLRVHRRHRMNVNAADEKNKALLWMDREHFSNRATTRLDAKVPQNNNNNNNALMAAPEELLAQPIGSLDSDADIIMEKCNGLDDFLRSMFDSTKSLGGSPDDDDSTCTSSTKQEPAKQPQQSTTDNMQVGLSKPAGAKTSSSASSISAQWNEWDVPIGRAMEVREFIGNVRYRNLIQQYRTAYLETPRKVDKTKIALTIYNTINSHGGRFLDKTRTKRHLRVAGAASAEPDEWYEIPKEKALAKIGQAMRLGPRPLRHERNLLPESKDKTPSPRATPAQAIATAQPPANEAQDEAKLFEGIFDSVTLGNAPTTDEQRRESSCLNLLADLLFAGEEDHGNSQYSSMSSVSLDSLH